MTGLTTPFNGVKHPSVSIPSLQNELREHQASPITPATTMSRAAASPAAAPTTMRLNFVATGLNDWITKLQRMCITKEFISAAWLSETLVPVLHDAIELLTHGASASSKTCNLAHDMDFTCSYVVHTAEECEMIRRSDVRSVVLQQMRCALQELHRTYPEQLPKPAHSFTNLLNGVRPTSYKSLEPRPSAGRPFSKQRVAAVLAAIMPCLFAPPHGGAIRL